MPALTTRYDGERDPERLAHHQAEEYPKPDGVDPKRRAADDADVGVGEREERQHDQDREGVQPELEALEWCDGLHGGVADAKRQPAAGCHPREYAPPALRAPRSHRR